jgi:maleylacetoacetate isomerase
MIRFHGYFRSSSSYRCRIAFNLKSLKYDFVPVHLRRDGGELAIIEWLDETFPEPPLLPASKDARAKVRAFAQVIACDIHPLQNLRVLDYLKGELGQDQAAADRWCRRWIGEGLQACERLLDREGAAGLFCFGDAPGLADVCLVPQIFSAERFEVDLTDMPRLREIHAACEKLPAFADAHPTRQSDSED